MMRWTILALLAAIAFAQDQTPDAAQWAAGLTDRFQRYTSRVVSAHALAGLADAVCTTNKIAGAQIYRLAIARINGVPVADFDDVKSPVLPVASFTKLWRTTEANAFKCDPTLASAYDARRFEDRILEERTHIDSRLAKAREQMDDEMKLPVGLQERADRVAQLVESVIDCASDAKAPALAKFATIGGILSRVRDRYPEGADRVWRYGVSVILDARAPDTSLLHEMGKYLFVAPGLRQRYDWEYAESTVVIGSTLLTDFRATRYSTNPDLIEMYIDALLKMAEIGGPNYDATITGGIAVQMLPKARDLELNSAQMLERLVAQTSGSVLAALGGSAADPETGEPAARRDRVIRQTLREAARGRIDEARSLVSGIDNTRVSGQVAVLIMFAEARDAIAKKDWPRAMMLANLLPGGVKRALLYAGIMASAPRDVAIQELGLQVRDIEPLPAEFRISLFSAASQTMLDADPQQALLQLNQAMRSANDTLTRNLAARFDPTRRLSVRERGAAAETDVPLIARGESTLQEAVDAGLGRHYFPLSVSGVAALNLRAAFSAAHKLDFRRLEAIAVELRDERMQAEALLAIAASQLQ